MKALLLSLIVILCTAVSASAADGVITLASSFTVKETADRMEQILNQKGMTIFSRIHHSDNAEKVGIKLQDMELIIFGNPKIGSVLMQCQQCVAIDLPQKVLIWEDGQAKVWISYNDPRYLQKRHALSGCEEVLAKIEKALAGITRSASNE